jgi:hypothetical protein
LDNKLPIPYTESKIMDNSDEIRVTDLCKSAFHAEHHGKFAEADALHTKAIQGLTRLVNDAGFLDYERKQVARKQIKFHTARQQLIWSLKEGSRTEPPVILPTSVGAKEEMLTTGNGVASISSVCT